MAREDLFVGSPIATTKAIPLEEPDEEKATDKAEIEGIGQPSNACFLTFSKVDPQKWYNPPHHNTTGTTYLNNLSHNRWLFEKYDGVRGFWNPITKAFYSRKGKTFTLPTHIIDAMPTDIFLDGEFW